MSEKYEAQEEVKLKRKVQGIVIAAMSLFFVLVTVVVFQFAIRIGQRSQVNALKKQNAALAKQTERALREADYFDSADFVYDFALMNENKGRPDDKIFI